MHAGVHHCVIPNTFLFRLAPSSALCTLSLHDALPISVVAVVLGGVDSALRGDGVRPAGAVLIAERLHVVAGLAQGGGRSEEHTSELQSRGHLVCRLLLVKR